MKVAEADNHWRDFFYTELTTGLQRNEICELKRLNFDETEENLDEMIKQKNA